MPYSGQDLHAHRRLHAREGGGVAVGVEALVVGAGEHDDGTGRALRGTAPVSRRAVAALKAAAWID